MPHLPAPYNLSISPIGGFAFGEYTLHLALKGLKPRTGLRRISDIEKCYNTLKIFKGHREKSIEFRKRMLYICKVGSRVGRITCCLVMCEFIKRHTH